MAQKNLQVDEVTLKSRAKNKQIRIMDSLSQPNEEKIEDKKGQKEDKSKEDTAPKETKKDEKDLCNINLLCGNFNH